MTLNPLNCGIKTWWSLGRRPPSTYPLTQSVKGSPSRLSILIELFLCWFIWLFSLSKCITNIWCVDFVLNDRENLGELHFLQVEFIICLNRYNWTERYKRSMFNVQPQRGEVLPSDSGFWVYPGFTELCMTELQIRSILIPHCQKVASVCWALQIWHLSRTLST